MNATYFVEGRHCGMRIGLFYIEWVARHGLGRLAELSQRRDRVDNETTFC